MLLTTRITELFASKLFWIRVARRVPGKKYPQLVDTYIGIITPEGVVESGKKKISLAGIEVKEYGFSRTVWELCPEGWKTPLGEDWEDVLMIIIKKWSPETYLRKERTVKKETDFHYQFEAQMSSLSRRIYKEHGVDVSELQRLKTSIWCILKRRKWYRRSARNDGGV